jgi:hypothetical protein
LAASNIIQLMTKNNFYISLGVWLIVIPILGIPGVWRYRIIELTGLFLVIHSAWPAILKRVSQKPRVKKAKIEKSNDGKIEEIKPESIVFHPEEPEEPKKIEIAEENVSQ